MEFLKTDFKAEALAIEKRNEEFWAKQNSESMKLGGASADIARAAFQARSNVRESDLFPNVDDDGRWVYTQEQGIKAACHAREDASATLILQHTQLEHLHRLAGVKKLLWVCIGLLAYIASKLS